MAHVTPLVSVITPAYNVAPWIGETIRSVLAQTESRFEYVIVDDGSKDETAAIVSEIAERDPRVRLIKTDNGGSGRARNIAITETSAPFIAFIDGDDVWHPKFLSTALKVLSKKTTVGATFSHTRVLLENGHRVGFRLQPGGLCDLDRFLLDHNPPHNGSSLVLRRSCFDEAGLFSEELRSGVDFEMWLRILSESSTPAFWGIRRWHVAMRLMRTGSISSDRSARYRALDGILGTYAPKMTRSHPGLAYVRPAVFAYRDGYDDIADAWASEAVEAGRAAVASDHWGVAMLSWMKAGPRGRRRMRAGRESVRSSVYKTLAARQKLVARTRERIAGS